MNLVSVSQMLDLEKEANDSGLGYDQMMLNAGSALADVIHERYGSGQQKHILGLIGSGNNGGDTLIALSKLIEKGWLAAAYLVNERKQKDALITKLIEMNCDVVPIKEDPSFERLRKLIDHTDLILDGILGTGIKLPLRKSISEVLQVFAGMENMPDIVAVDCPSGVDCDTGEAAEDTLSADLTVCMANVKKGLLKFPAFEYVGEIACVDIGLPENLSGYANMHSSVVDQMMVRKMLPSRPLNAHKGTFGTCMIVGGSINYCGAVILSARSAYRVGAGLVQAAIPGCIYDAIAGQVPECTWVVLPHSMGVIGSSASATLQENLERVDAMLVGPGMGQEKETLDFIKELLRFKETGSGKLTLGFSQHPRMEKTTHLFTQPSLVFDADALKLISHIEKWYQLPEKIAVLTPHPGEMAILTGMTVEEIQKDRESIAREFAQKWGHVVVLKGAVTIVAAPDGHSFFIPIATPALASAGTGDVLAGMITGLLAQNISAIDAAVAGAWLHAQAGLAAEKSNGQNVSVTAGDVINQIPFVLK
ncbi:MAG: NAD(P)H-hydrate dehydratase [Pelolinea sp.]|nr:NAD(P)H-hydrate dehydratase [Pelolinea sp.]